MTKETNLQLPKAQYVEPADLDAVLSEHARVVVDITGEGWCPWCDMLDPIIRRFMWQYPNLHVVKIDSDKADQLPDSFEVKGKGVPHLLAFENGRLTVHGGFDTEYANMAKWFAAAAGVADPYADAAFEKEFAATADQACATFRTTMTEKGKPYIEANAKFEQAWRERKEALEASHAAGEIDDAEFEREMAANNEKSKEREPIIAPYFELRKTAVGEYVATIESAVLVLVASASGSQTESPTEAPGAVSVDGDAVADDAGAACAIGDKNCTQ